MVMKDRPGNGDAEGLNKACHELETAGCGPAAQGSFVADKPQTDADCGKVRESWSLLGVLVLAVSLGPLAMSSFIPAIPAIQSSFAVPAAVAQLTLSVSMWSMALCSLAYGSLADSYGRRSVLLGGVGIAIAGSAMCALAPSIEWVIAGRALQAAGATSGFVLARVIVRDVYGDSRAASVLGYITAAMTLAPMVGPILGGYLIEAAGWRSIFASVSGIAVLLWLLLAAQLPETRPATAAAAPLFDLPGFARLLQLTEYRRYLLFGTMAQSTFMAFLAGAPYIVTQYFGLPATAYGFYFIAVPIGFAIGSFTAGHYGELIGHERLLYLGAGGSLTACLVALWLSLAAGYTPWSLFLPMAVVAVCQGMSMPGAQVGILVAAGPRSGAASGLFSFAQLMVGGLAAQLVGVLIGFGPVAVTAIITCTSALACMALLLTPRPLVSQQRGG